MSPGKNYDIIVIGGGASGLGIALDAVSRGLYVLLIEQADFAKGTSSRSTKLVHGGVRYLAQGDVKLVREASVERAILLRNAGHLVRNQAFLVPVYSWFDKLKYYIGLKLYDWIAGSLSLGSSVALSREETVRRMPGIRSAGLRGAILYHDGQFDDARLAINLAQTIVEKGGEVRSYTAVTALLKDSSGNVCGVETRRNEAGGTDSGTSALQSFNASVVINATGVFADEILRMDRPGSQPTIRPSQGVHLVLDRDFLPSDDALMIPKTSDGRVLFAVPWHDKLVLGTTDTPVEHASMEPRALEAEISFILHTAAEYLTRQPARTDVLSVFAGLRPLAAPTGDGAKTKEISRSHKIIRADSGMYTIIGGKWTTYRKMGEDMIDRIVADKHWKNGASQTKNLSIHGNLAGNDLKDPLGYYGSDKNAVLEMIRSYPSAGWLSERYHVHAAQVQWSVEKEMAKTVEDFLARRTRVLFIDVQEAVRMAPAVATIMASLLGRTEQWITDQVQAFNLIAENYRTR